MRKQQQLLDIAQQEAQKSGQNFRHGAVLVKNGKIVSAGHNRVTSRPGSHVYSTHAEMAAIKHCSERTSDAHLYVVRVRKCGALADSKPCPRCQKFMKMHGIQRVFYSTGDDDDPFDSMYMV